MKTKFFALFCAVLLLFTGCVPEPQEDDFEDFEIVETPKVENVTAQTEFNEYKGDVKAINVKVTNNSGKDFLYETYFFLDKNVNGEWKRIKTEGYNSAYQLKVKPNETKSVRVSLKDYTRLPLLPGHYRVWVGTFGNWANEHILVPAEFDVK